jgi:hypothetical protein
MEFISRPCSFAWDGAVSDQPLDIGPFPLPDGRIPATGSKMSGLPIDGAPDEFRLGQTQVMSELFQELSVTGIEIDLLANLLCHDSTSSSTYTLQYTSLVLTGQETIDEG